MGDRARTYIHKQTDRQTQTSTHMNDDVKIFTTAKFASIEGSRKYVQFFYTLFSFDWHLKESRTQFLRD